MFHLAKRKDASFAYRSTQLQRSQILCQLNLRDSLGGILLNKGLGFHLQGIKGCSKASKTELLSVQWPESSEKHEKPQ